MAEAQVALMQQQIEQLMQAAERQAQVQEQILAQMQAQAMTPAPRVCIGQCQSPRCRRDPARCRGLCARPYRHRGLHLCIQGRPPLPTRVQEEAPGQTFNPGPGV